MSVETAGASDTASFGFRDVPAGEKAAMVAGVFSSVARRYDIMNDVLSGGLHRLWKDSVIDSLRPFPGMKLIDVAGGTGDIGFRAHRAMKGEGHVTLVDINPAMLGVGRDRAIDQGYLTGLDFVVGDAEALPFEDGQFDAYTISFGIRNVTRIEKAIAEAYRVLKPGGRFLVLEFSPKVAPSLKGFYDHYSFDLLPKLGQIIADDAESYRYLAESIRRFPAPQAFADMIAGQGFQRVSWRSFTGGIACLHTGVKI